ncbi:hypothetical protein BCR35DRAFT_307207 [Leucosporidium creatinivorum]|uniref:F-box domain-containing protein n=1 Tax=Leucosporidium creatinivorum TaxID=106004 RepID=A0A1Y2EPH8_9BASI|nr:hypothetical protein BCR35DRAFT_307207 [Leucosporidium creatinivorum]
MAPKRPRKKKQDDDYTQQGLSDSDYEAPKKKVKAKAGGSKAKGKGKAKKKLELFTSAPLDVLTLVFSHLDTSTLLAVSRTCRVFRQLTHAPSGKGLWVAARANTPGQLPTLQASDFPEWEYASLVFDRNCWGCQKGRAVTVDYTIRLRGCAACMRKLSLRREKIHGSFHRLTFDCVPVSIWNSFEFHNVTEARRISRRLVEVEARSKEEGASPSLFADFVLERKKVVKAATLDGQAIQRWESRHKQEMANAGYQAAINRRKQIESKMRELGYTDDDLDSYAFTSHSLVNQQRDLTDRIWNTIRAPLIAAIEEDRAKRARIALSRRQVGRQKSLLPFYQSLLDAQPSDLARATFPPISDFGTFDSIRQLWEDDEKVIDETALEAAKPAVVAEANKFVRMFKIATFSKLAKAHADSKVFVDPLAPTTYHTAPNHSATDMEELSMRVTSAFPCPMVTCNHFATFPFIFAHAKSEHNWAYEYGPSSYSWPPTGGFGDSTLKISANQINAIRLVLRAVNSDATLPVVDEATTTTKDLDDLGARFQCVGCPGIAKEQAAAAARALEYARYAQTPPAPPTLAPMTWSELVGHSLGGHDPRSARYSPSATYTPPNIAILPPPLPPAVVAEEEKAEVDASMDTNDKVKTGEIEKVEGDVKMEAQDEEAAVGVGASSATKEG